MAAESKNQKADKEASGMAFFRGEWFSGGGYKKNLPWVILVVSLLFIYMAFKFNVQVKIEEVRKARKELRDTRTGMIHVTSQFGSRTRESEMVKMVDTLKLNLKASEQPPYNLDN